MKPRSFAALIICVILLAGCATDLSPAGYRDYCARHQDRQECGGTK